MRPRLSRNWRPALLLAMPLALALATGAGLTGQGVAKPLVSPAAPAQGPELAPAPGCAPAKTPPFGACALPLDR